MWILQKNKGDVENSQSKAKRLVLHLEEKGYSKKESRDMVYWRWEDKWIAEKRWWINSEWRELEKWIGFTDIKKNKIETPNPFKNEYMKKLRSRSKV